MRRQFPGVVLGAVISLLFVFAIRGVAAPDGDGSEIRSGEYAWGIVVRGPQGDYIIPLGLGRTATPTTATPAPGEPTTTPLPSTPTEEAGRCYGHAAESGLRVRSSPDTSSATNILGYIGPSDTLTLEARLPGWYRIYWFPDQAGYVWAALIVTAPDAAVACKNLPFAPVVRLGLHLLYSAQAEVVLPFLDQMGSLKGTDGSEAIIRAAEHQRPGVISVWRSIYLPGGKWDCPPNWGQGDARLAASQWWAWQYTTWKQRGLLGVVDYFEYRNECLFIPGWEMAFDLRIIQLANSAGVCVAAFSDAYGNPEIAQFVQRQAVLDAMLARPCAPGRYHAIGYHVYEGVNGGPWKFGRYELFLEALGDARYRRLPWLVTEYSYSSGRGSIDCDLLWADARAAAIHFGPEVWGFMLYSVGGGSEWSDMSPCLGK